MDKAPVRYVAHLDILGMASIVSQDHDEAWEMLSALVESRDDATNISLEFEGREQPIHIPEHVRAVTFSDTIFLFTRGATDSDLRSITIAVSQLFSSALFQCVPVRVGVAKGVCYVNLERSMYAGPALIESYYVGESAQWIGVVFAPSVADEVKALGLTTGKSNVVVDWPVPAKASVSTMSVLNWPATMSHQLKVSPPFTPEGFYSIFEQTFGPFERLPAPVRAKYQNTVEFFNAQYAAHVA